MMHSLTNPTHVTCCYPQTKKQPQLARFMLNLRAKKNSIPRWAIGWWRWLSFQISVHPKTPFFPCSSPCQRKSGKWKMVRNVWNIFCFWRERSGFESWRFHFVWKNSGSIGRTLALRCAPYRSRVARITWHVIIRSRWPRCFVRA